MRNRIVRLQLEPNDCFLLSAHVPVRKESETLCRLQIWHGFFVRAVFRLRRVLQTGNGTWNGFTQSIHTRYERTSTRLRTHNSLLTDIDAPCQGNVAMVLPYGSMPAYQAFVTSLEFWYTLHSHYCTLQVHVRYPHHKPDPSTAGGSAYFSGEWTKLDSGTVLQHSCR